MQIQPFLLTNPARKYNNRYLPLIGCALAWLCSATVAPAQADTSLLLEPERLTESDIRFFDHFRQREKIVSATLVEERPQDLPFSTWVITSDDILRYGFVTLTDVLKAAPGIRVSQPGNAIEGETFMMQGLSGNQYVKILINGMPVKPTLALGMPIGAQLPIRQAERIEVLYGAGGGMLYGNEACAGVVNIILKETERPIFTQADLGFGALGFNSLDLTFGGKLFKDKNILKFSLFGSSTVRSDADIFWDQDAYKPRNYLYQGMNGGDLQQMSNLLRLPGTDSVRTSPAAHESRLLGVLLTWKGLSFQYNRMSRSDASYLGMNPLASSYVAQGNAYQDRIDTYLLRYRFEGEKSVFTTSLSVATYNVLNTSSARHIFDKVRAVAYLSRGGDTLPDAQRWQLQHLQDSLYVSGQRFMMARSVDVRGDLHVKWRIWRKLWWDLGGQVLFASGRALTSHYSAPPPVRLGETDFQGPFTPDLIINTGIHAFTGFDWQGTHLRVTGGLSAMPTLIETGLQTGYGPRIGILYRIDSSHVLFGNYAQSFKLFHENQKKLSYTYSVFDIGHRFDFPNITENFKSAELGYRLNKSGVSVFWQESYNLLRDGYFVRLGDGIGWGGYEYAPGLAQRLWGVQGRLVAENTQTIQKKRNEKEQLVTWRGEFFIQYARGREWFGYDLPSTAEVRNFPQWITQFRSSGRTGRLQVTLSSNRQTSVLSKAVPFYSMWKRDLLQERYPTFRTWDTQLRFFVNKNFVLYLHVFNIFDRKAYGIDATGTPDDLARPLQQGRLWRLGVNYNMN